MRTKEEVTQKDQRVEKMSKKPEIDDLKNNLSSTNFLIKQKLTKQIPIEMEIQSKPLYVIRLNKFHLTTTIK